MEQFRIGLGRVAFEVVALEQLPRRQLLEVDLAAVSIFPLVLEPDLECVREDLAHLIAESWLWSLAEQEDAQEGVVDGVAVLIELVECRAHVEQSSADADRDLGDFR